MEINYGVLPGRRPEDWMAGAWSMIPFEERNPSGDWRPYLPSAERQKDPAETMACVSFSALNSIEIQEKFLTGIEPDYSDRWIAKMSGTTQSGNWIYKVGDTIRNLGLVKQESYPKPDSYTWDTYYADIPEPKLSELRSEGESWLRRWDVKTEFIEATRESLLNHIRHAPIQIVLPGHAIVAFLCARDIVSYFDTYKPFEKTTPYGSIQTAYKYVLTPKTMYTTKKVKINGAYGVLVDMPNNSAISKAEDETEWRSYSKPDSYGVKTINGDGTTNWDVDLEIKF